MTALCLRDVVREAFGLAITSIWMATRMGTIIA
jgi:hypothetical protein